ncbi:hypothetical protein BX600DRAFT_72176 [Xylariales sp. PMI_506]|nr:hypothetical protein BX600DRAFT_72176 [Xylariales sp. PMI_506]
MVGGTSSGPYSGNNDLISPHPKTTTPPPRSETYLCNINLVRTSKGVTMDSTLDFAQIPVTMCCPPHSGEDTATPFQTMLHTPRLQGDIFAFLQPFSDCVPGTICGLDETPSFTAPIPSNANPDGTLSSPCAMPTVRGGPIISGLVLPGRRPSRGTGSSPLPKTIIPSFKIQSRRQSSPSGTTTLLATTTENPRRNRIAAS